MIVVISNYRILTFCVSIIIIIIIIYLLFYYYY